MDYQKLDPRIVKSWKIARVIVLSLFIIASAILVFILKINNVPDAAFLTISLILLAIIIFRLIAVFVYPVIEYRQWSYIITEDKVEIKFGIFFVTTTIIPIVRVQHISISSGPINRKLGLAEVEINTASGKFKIKGLAKEVAEHISENLKSRLIVRLDDSNSKI